MYHTYDGHDGELGLTSARGICLTLQVRGEARRLALSIDNGNQSKLDVLTRMPAPNPR